LRVVVVEDDAVVLADLVAILSDAGHRVVGTAATAAEMAGLLDRERPQVAVFDVHLPGGDGLEVFQAAARAAPIGGIVVTGDTTDATRSRAGERDVTVYLSKPVVPKVLTDNIRIVAARAAAMDRTRQEVARLQASLMACGEGEPRDAVRAACARLVARGLSDDAAFAVLRDYSAFHGMNLDAAARLVLRGGLTVQLAPPPTHRPHRTPRPAAASPPPGARP
jgi:DNA-binding NarL/FixJ family response regulator